MPVPLGLVVKKGTKRLAVVGSPGPSSRTSTSMASLRTAQVTSARAAGGPGRFGGVFDQVNQHLVELITIGLNGDRRSLDEPNGRVALEPHRAANPSPTSSGARVGGGSLASLA